MYWTDSLYEMDSLNRNSRHERFWATMKVEFYGRYPWPTKAAATGDGTRANCSKRPASLWAQDEAVPLGSVVAVALAESLDQHARD
jgi:hypothetical protein